MGLPKATINVNNDRLGKSNQTDDTIAGLIITGVTVAGSGNVTAGNVYQLFNLKGASDIGIVSGGTNDFAYQQIKHFYDQAGSGAELWIMLVASTVLMSEMVDKDEAHAVKILDAASGRIRNLAVSRRTGSGITVANGVDQDVDAAAIKAQALAQLYTDKYKPLRVVIDGKDYNGTVGDLKDYKTTSLNRVGILLGNDNAGKNAAVGLLIGRWASNPVQRSAGRVKDGDLGILNGYLNDGTSIESNEDELGAIHDKGYIVLRTHAGKAGYFFSDDPTLTADSDDLSSFKRVAVIDKATLVALGVYVDNILDEIPLSEDGKISPAVLGNWKADVEQALNIQMIAEGNISGAKATIDPAQDILGTDEIKITLDVLPVGYSKYITVELGFTKSLTE